MLKLNGYIINPTEFPDSTNQVWKLQDEAFLMKDFMMDEISTGYVIEWAYRHDGEIMQLQQLVDLLNTIMKSPNHDFIKLFMPFLPYGRQDKPISNDTTFGLYSFSQMINAMGFDEVETIDAHNAGACFSLFNNFRNTMPWGQIGGALGAMRPNIIVYPDTGAMARYQTGIDYYNAEYTVAATKSRDQSTGELISMQFPKEIPAALQGSALIIDDICDGGATFIKVAELLHRYGVHDIGLYVTHGIFSRGLKHLTDRGIQRIFTKDGELLQRGR